MGCQLWTPHFLVAESPKTRSKVARAVASHGPSHPVTSAEAAGAHPQAQVKERGAWKRGGGQQRTDQPPEPSKLGQGCSRGLVETRVL